MGVLSPRRALACLAASAAVTPLLISAAAQGPAHAAAAAPANTFGVGDRYFASVAGPTFPNRFYLYAGTSFGHIQNDLSGPGGYTQATILRSLTTAGISWKVYFSQVPFAGLFADFQQHPENAAPISQF